MLSRGQTLMLLVIALLVFGVIMVNSAGIAIEVEEGTYLGRVLFSRAALFALLAIGAMILGACVPLDQLYRARGVNSPMPWIIVGMVVLLLLVYVPGIGREANNSRRWISAGGLGFQPSEVAKWGVLIVIAWYAARRAGAMGRIGTGFMPPLLLLGGLCAVIAIEDLGTAVLIAVVGMAVLMAGGVKLWQVALLVPVGIVGFIGAVLHSEYRVRRLLAYTNPFDDPQGVGYHIIQSMAAVTNGGLAGRGLGNGVRKFGYLPEDTTDFIYAIVCEELGVFGAAFVIFLYIGILFVGYLVIRGLTHPFLRLLALGILLTIGVQAIINIAVVTGAAPTKGIALPLVSRGGTGWILTAFSVGLLIWMDRHGHRMTLPLSEHRTHEPKRAEHPVPNASGGITPAVA